MKKQLLLLIAILLVITIMNTDQIEYNYKIVSDDVNEEIINLECYRLEIINYKILFWGDIYYNQQSYDFNFITWYGFPFSRTEKLHISDNEDAKFSYTHWIKIRRNLEELYVDILMIDKHTHSNSLKSIKAMKIK